MTRSVLPGAEPKVPRSDASAVPCILPTLACKHGGPDGAFTFQCLFHTHGRIYDFYAASGHGSWFGFVESRTHFGGAPLSSSTVEEKISRVRRVKCTYLPLHP